MTAPDSCCGRTARHLFRAVVFLVFVLFSTIAMTTGGGHGGAHGGGKSSGHSGGGHNGGQVGHSGGCEDNVPKPVDHGDLHTLVRATTGDSISAVAPG